VSSAAVFLDRDGVLNELVHDPVAKACESPLRVEDVRLLEGASCAAGLARAGFVLLCVSNQPAAAKGAVSIQRLVAVHDRVLELLAHEGVCIAASRLCLHHPQGVVPELSGPCHCRKPAAGMLFDLADALQVDLDASWMVGDTDADVAAGRAAGARTVLVETRGSAHKRAGAIEPDLRVANLPEAVTTILDVVGVSRRQL
jgi:D-glycero-D-manno-heptose 1,7-bisphosphate phosphatase